MNLHKAVALEIASLNLPVITLYQIAVVIFKLNTTHAYKEKHIASLKKTRPARKDCFRTVRSLIESGVLEESHSVRHEEVYNVLGREHGAAEEIACAIDPFAYVSHLSAMEWHGLTDRIGHTLIYSSPPPTNWRRFAGEKMQKDIGKDHIQDYLTQDLPHLKRLNIKKIGRTRIHRYSSEHLGAFISVKDRCLRVSTIGRTFLEMIREPNLCGGIYHVLDVFDEFGKRYLKLIIDDIDRHGTKIDKVRAGYILEERMNLSEPRIESWRKFAQRGGSRKLVAGSSYSHEYSEHWCLSINVDGSEVE